MTACCESLADNLFCTSALCNHSFQDTIQTKHVRCWRHMACPSAIPSVFTFKLPGGVHGRPVVIILQAQMSWQICWQILKYQQILQQALLGPTLPIERQLGTAPGCCKCWSHEKMRSLMLHMKFKNSARNFRTLLAIYRPSTMQLTKK